MCGRYADAVLKDGAKVVRGSVANGAGYLADSIHGVAEKLPGLRKPKLLDILVQGDAHRAGKEIGKIAGVHLQGGGHVAQLHRPRVMVVNVVQHPLSDLSLAVAASV
jgi:hypothetical protein